MGRRIQLANLEGQVRQARLALGLSQGQLAVRTGLTRQAISSIENGQYVPNTAVALTLARALRCTVEDLFALPESPADHRIELASGSTADARRLAVANVAGRWVGYPLAGGRELQQGFISADVLLPPSRSWQEAQYLTPPDRLEGTAVLLGCDPSLGILSAHLAAQRADARLLWLSASSQAALDAVMAGEAHLAGTHLRDPDRPTFNLFHARRALAQTGGLVVEFARWEAGLVVLPGNPKGLRSVEDLIRPDVRVVNRESGSGSRALLDELLERAGIPGERVAGYTRLVGSHMAAAAAVASGGADAAIALQASALALGLDFVPLDEMRFDFVIPRPHMAHPTVAHLLEVLQSAALRSELGALPGYDVAGMGTIKLDLALDQPKRPPRRAATQAG
jgi:molybdate-binding protein/DNA-binding XRE family transcriptional regulator